MGGLNLKLMQGIEEAEGLIKQGKQPQKAPASETKQEKKAEEASAGAQKVPATARKPKASSRKEEGKKGREEKQVFSFRAPLGEIAAWKAFATATGETMEHIGCMAMDEYLKRHKLTETELAVFEALREREEKRQTARERG